MNFFNKIILINPLKTNILSKKIINIKSKKTLKDDLKNIYKKFSKEFISINYAVYINLNENINLNKISRLIRHTIYNNYDHLLLAKK